MITKNNPNLIRNTCLPGPAERGLAEAVILQALEDIWEPAYRRESLGFFQGKGFALCADIAGMDTPGRLSIISMVKKTISQ
ncbi:MAG: hypothetical protein M0Q43_04020 [Methanothrix sp.]|jgi:hypothetical protein|nr:hypothetical protein [Methanothrix sp.]